MKTGYVYILTNPAFAENWVKIGKTAGTVQKRMEELYTTALPLPFELYAWCKTTKFNELEKQAHHILDKLTDYRIADNREFFRIVPSEALDVLRELAATIDDAEFFCPFEVQEKAAKTKILPPFKFSYAHMKPGDVVTFEPTGAKAVVVADKNDNKIEFEGQLYTLSGFCKVFMPDNKRNKKEAYQGPHYFSYNGKLLCDIRAQYENQEE